MKSRYEFDYEFPIYPGHGTILNLKYSGGDDWYNEAADAYTALESRVDTIYIIGFSMGGVFASHLAQHGGVEKLLLIAPAFDHTKLTRLGRLKLTPRHFSEHMKMNMYSKIKKRIRDIPLAAFQEFKKIVETKRAGMEKVRSETLIVHGKIDLLVPYQSSIDAADKIPGAKVQLIEDSPHLFAYTEDAQLELNIIAERFLFENK